MSPSKKSFRSKPKNTLSRKIIVSPPGLVITEKRKPEGPGWACGFLMVVGLGFVGGGGVGDLGWVQSIPICPGWNHETNFKDEMTLPSLYLCVVTSVLFVF